MPYALQLMQGKIDEVKASLPSQTTVAVERMTPSLFPIFSFNVTGSIPPADLRDLAAFELRPLLSRVPGVANVEVLASEEREISVIVNPVRLNAAKLSIDQVAEALRTTNVVTAVGRLPKDYLQYLVLAHGGTDEPRGRAEGRGGVPRRHARLLGRHRRRARGRHRSNHPDLRRGEGRRGSQRRATDRRQHPRRRRRREGRLNNYRASLPPSVRLTVVYDLADFVRNAVASVRDAIVIGGLLAVLVLVFFLRDWRVTAIAATSLPLTIVGTFFVLHLVGGTINLMSLGGLAIAIGLVIDDAIVVVENIHRHRSAGETVPVAAERGTQELLAAVIGSTLTTVVVFVPLGLLQGVVGQFFAALSMTLAAAVLLSLGTRCCSSRHRGRFLRPTMAVVHA